MCRTFAMCGEPEGQVNKTVPNVDRTDLSSNLMTFNHNLALKMQTWPLYVARLHM